MVKDWVAQAKELPKLLEYWSLAWRGAGCLATHLWSNQSL